MGFGKLLKEQKIFVYQRTVRGTRKQHQRGQYSKKSSAETQLFLSESHNSQISTFLNFSASASNSRRAMKKHPVLLISERTPFCSLQSLRNLSDLKSDFSEKKPFFGKEDKERKMAKQAISYGKSRQKYSFYKENYSLKDSELI